MEPTSTGHPARRSPWSTAFFAINAIFFTVGIIFFIMSVVALFQFPSFSVASASVSAFNVAASSVSGVWDITFDVRNSKASPFSFEHIHTSLHYEKTKLSQTSLAPFHQGGRNRKTVRTTLAAVGAYVEPLIINALNAEWAASGSVDFTVEFTADVYYRVWWKQKLRNFDMKCNKVSLALPVNSKNGTLAGGPQGCVMHYRVFG